MTSSTARGPVIAAVVLLGLFLVLVGTRAAHTTYRFAQYGTLADARILSSDMGCFGASGGGSTTLGTRSTISYVVEFPTDDGVHRTTVKRPCDVIPPDFGRGRGSIWVEYDRDDPDLIRVQNDQHAAVQTQIFGFLLGVYVLSLVVVLSRTRRRHPRLSSASD